MGRRSLHTPEQLRNLILDAARTIIETQGLPKLSAREIARLIGYSPGTLYNIFENLDDVLLTLQAQMLGDVVEVMQAASAASPSAQRVDNLSKAFLNFALSNRQMWNVLLAHYPDEGVAIPPALHDRVNAIVTIVAESLRPLMKNAEPAEVDLAARALWGGVYGLTSIAVTSKGPTMTPSNAELYVRKLTSTFVKGLAQS
ncbi:MAG: TetR/AcrR family transcriptional regulator [Hyphomicrobium sp.]